MYGIYKNNLKFNFCIASYDYIIIITKILSLLYTGELHENLPYIGESKNGMIIGIHIRALESIGLCCTCILEAYKITCLCEQWFWNRWFKKDCC